MLRFPQLSLASSPVYVSLFIIGALCLFIGTFWAYNEYHAYQETVANIRLNYQQQYKLRLKEESNRIVDFIEYKRSQQGAGIEAEIREKVQSAFSIASHVYSLYKEEKSMAELRSMVVELLRPIRWDNGLGYYFVGNVSSGTIELLADNPELEGMPLDTVDDKNFRDVVAAIMEVVAKRGAGMVHYTLTKPESPGSSYPKISFVKLFEPFEWFVGAGVYSDEMKRRIQQDILDRIQRLRFGMEGEVMIFRLDGTILCSTDKKLLGRSVLSIREMTDNGSNSSSGNFGSTLLTLADSEDKSGFYEHSRNSDDREKLSERLVYVTTYADWDWVIVTSISMLEMEKLIDHETLTYQNIAFRNTTLFLILFSAAVAVLLLLSYFYSLKIKKGIEHFTGFFRRAADSKIRVERDKLSFREFVVLGDYANRMNEDRLSQEKTIMRDEKRLDTLLQLGLMESYSLREIFVFTLQRIIEITESRAAYLVTVDDGEPVLRSQVLLLEQGLQIIEVSREGQVNSDRSLAEVISSRQTQVRRHTGESPSNTFFPVEDIIVHRLDVPVVENGAVVAVLGLCNKENGYDEDDTRQVTLLLEGMWLHISKVSNRKEMQRLRRLLKNITDSMPSVLIGVDSELRVMQWNLLAEKYSGVTATQAQGRFLGELLPHIQCHENEIRQVVSKGVQAEIRRSPVMVDGKTRYESITIYPLRHDETQGAVLRLDDVTERVNLEEMMIQSEKMLSVGGLAAGIAHEINNPLASVSQNLQVIKKRLALDLPQNRSAAEEIGVGLDDIHAYLRKRGIDKMLNIIDDDSTRAVKLVRNMLSFSRKSTSIFTSCDLRMLLDNALQLGLADYEMEKNYAFGKINIKKEYDENIGTVHCEGTNIQQVFFNIIRNAAHAIAENREHIETPQLTLRILDEKGMARVEIEDNGIGMDSITSKKIFEPFFTTKGVGKGTGLGLSISYYIVTEQHKGSLLVRSRPTQGTVFIIVLPFEQRRDTEEKQS